MGRIIRILIYAVVILAIYFWIMTTLNHWYAKRNERNAQFRKSINDTSTVVVDTAGSDLMAEMDTVGLIKSEEIIKGVINYEDVDKKAKSLEKTKTNKVVEESKPAVKPKLVEIKSLPSKALTSDQNGKFLVIAGSYLLKENAMKMVKKLKSKGYESATTVVFQASEYHSVIATTKASRADADATVKSLKASGIDSFVKAK